jgi:hypothetical protein
VDNKITLLLCLQIVYSRQGSRLSNSSRDSGQFGIVSSPSVSPHNGVSMMSPLLSKTGTSGNFYEFNSPQNNGTRLPDNDPGGTGMEHHSVPSLNNDVKNKYSLRYTTPSPPSGVHGTATACEACSQTYVNNGVHASQHYDGLHGGYERLTQVRSELGAASADASDADIKYEVQEVQQDALMRSDGEVTQSVVGLSLTPALTDGSRDSGYVQHDEWMSQVLGISS